MTKALITGVTGQDGSYLAEYLASEGVEVFGMIRDPSHPRREWIERLVPGIRIVVGDLRDPLGLQRLIASIRPDEIYNLAAITTPGESWSADPTPHVAEVTGIGVVNLLRATLQSAPNAHLVHASSSAVYASNRYGLYGVAKRLAHDAVIGFRTQEHLFAANAVFFSHTSPRQSPRFLIRRIVRHVVDVKQSSQSSFIMTNRESKRDWGWAPDYVCALTKIARGDVADDVDVKTGQLHPVATVAQIAASYLNVDWNDVTHGWPRTNITPTWHEATSESHSARVDVSECVKTRLSEIVTRLVDYEIAY